MGEDFFEYDNDIDTAKEIYPTGWVQSHTFHDANDRDWVYFYGHKDRIYTIKAQDVLDTNQPITISLFDSNNTLIESENNYIHRPFFQDNYYYLLVENGGEYVPDGIAYDLWIKRAPSAGRGSRRRADATCRL